MALEPCVICRRRFLGKAVVLYTAWVEDGTRSAVKQRLCLDCAKEHSAKWLRLALDENDGQVQLPLSCPSCGTTLPENELTLSYHTAYYHGERRDSTLALCEQCHFESRATFTANAEPLADRVGAGGRSGGAPTPPPAQIKVALPW